jgi:chromate transporter
MTGVTAAVVGAILNLGVWFGAKVFFLDAGIDGFALACSTISLFVLKKFYFPIQYLVPMGAVAGIVWRLVVLS